MLRIDINRGDHGRANQIREATHASTCKYPSRLEILEQTKHAIPSPNYVSSHLNQVTWIAACITLRKSKYFAFRQGEIYFHDYNHFYDRFHPFCIIKSSKSLVNNFYESVSFSVFFDVRNTIITQRRDGESLSQAMSNPNCVWKNILVLQNCARLQSRRISELTKFIIIALIVEQVDMAMITVLTPREDLSLVVGV